MSTNSILVDSGSKGWCNIYAQNLTAYNNLDVGGDIIQNGNVIALPNAGSDIEVRDLTAHGRIYIEGDDNNHGGIVFEVEDGNNDPIMVIDGNNKIIAQTSTEIDGLLTANEITVNGNVAITSGGNIGTVGNIFANQITVGNNSSPINKFDTEVMNLNIPTNALVSQATTIGFSAFRMGNISPGGRSLVNIIVDLKDDIQTNNANGVITLNAIPNIYRPNNPVATIISILDGSDPEPGEVKALLDVNGVITISLMGGGNLTGDGNPIQILTNIVFTFNQVAP